ncbi:MAG: hypothetical protein ACK5HR_00280 [Mycoplasmatales bacterium]
MKKLTITSLFALLLIVFTPLAMDAQTINEVKEIKGETLNSNVDLAKYINQAEAEALAKVEAKQAQAEETPSVELTIDEIGTLKPGTPLTISGTLTNGRSAIMTGITLKGNSYNNVKNSEFYNVEVTDALVDELAAGETDTFAVEISLTDNSKFTINEAALEAVLGETGTVKDALNLFSALPSDPFYVETSYTILGSETYAMAISTADIDASDNASIARTGDTTVKYTTSGTVELTYTNTGLNPLSLTGFGLRGSITQNGSITSFIDGKEFKVEEGDEYLTDIYTYSELILNPGDTMVIKVVNKGESLDKYIEDKLEDELTTTFTDLFFGEDFEENVVLTFDPTITDNNNSSNSNSSDDTTTSGSGSSNDEDTLTSTGAGVVMTLAASGSTLGGAVVLLRRKF